MTADNMPVYVKIDDYKEVLETIADLQKKIGNAKELLAQVDSIRNDEESELESWKMGVGDIEQKIADLKAVLSQAK